MSVEDNNKITELENTIATLNKALSRQKIANKLLEEKLDETLENQFTQNKKILESYETARIRQIQLQFLDFISPEQLDNKSTNEMLLYFVDNVSILFDSAQAYVFIINENRLISSYQKTENEWKKQKKLTSITNSILSLGEDARDKWHRLEAPFKNYSSLSDLLILPTALAISFEITDKSKRLILLNIPHYCYSNDFKQTLELAAQQFASNLKKRTAELEKSYNFQKLQKTISVLKSTQRKLAHNDKMVALGQLAAGVAHEVNNPLSYIISNLQSLDDYQKEINDEVKKIEAGEQTTLSDSSVELLKDVPELVTSCLDGLTRVGDIVKNLNTFSRQNNEDFSQVNINEVILSALKILGSRANGKLEQKLAPKLSLITGNFGQLQQVLVNLLINAIDSIADDINGKVSITSYQDAAAVIVEVVDNGIGMDNKTLKRLFDPFCHYELVSFVYF